MVRDVKVFLYLSTPGGLTGAPRRILTLCQVLSRHGVEPYVVGDPETDLYREAHRLGIKTVCLRTASILRERNKQLLKGGVLKRVRVALALVFHNAQFLFKVLKYRPQVIWFRSSKTFAFAGVGAYFSRRPIVWDVDYEVPSHGVVGALQRAALRVSKSVVLQYPKAEKRIFRLNDVQSNESKFIASVPGIQLNKLDKYVMGRRLRSTNSKGDFTLLHVGTVCERKNQLLMVEALAVLRDSYRDAWGSRKVVLALAGGVHEADYKDMVVRRVEDLGLTQNVEFLGWQSEVPALMVKADLLVLPSKDEGVPNTVQEAMYIGCPVAVGDAGGMPSIVAHGQTGWVLSTEECQPWANLFASFLTGAVKVESIVSEAQRYALEHFDDDAWGRSYASALKRLVCP